MPAPRWFLIGLIAKELTPPDGAVGPPTLAFLLVAACPGCGWRRLGGVSVHRASVQCTRSGIANRAIGRIGAGRARAHELRTVVGCAGDTPRFVTGIADFGHAVVAIDFAGHSVDVAPARPAAGRRSRERRARAKKHCLAVGGARV